MIVVFAFTQSISGRAGWGAIDNFGVLPLFAGLTVILSATRFQRLMFVTGAGMLATLFISLFGSALRKHDW
jgi:hypothetical protein